MRLVLAGLSMVALASCAGVKSASSSSVESANVGSDFYRCEGFAGVDEYRSGIDLKAKTADFFDNDSTSDMKLVSIVSLESIPPQTQITFEGKDLGSNGTLRLVFNQTKLKASISTIDKKGKSTLIGSAPCKKAARD